MSAVVPLQGKSRRGEQSKDGAMGNGPLARSEVSTLGQICKPAKVRRDDTTICTSPPRPR
jgi:hypothetical protein